MQKTQTYKKTSRLKNITIGLVVLGVFTALSVFARPYPTGSLEFDDVNDRPIYTLGEGNENQYVNTRLGVRMDPRSSDYGLMAFEDSKISKVKAVTGNWAGNVFVAGGNSPRIEDFYVSSNSNLISIDDGSLSDFQVEKNSDYSNLTLLENKNSLDINFSQEKSIAGGINSAEPNLSLDLINLVANQGGLGISSSYGISDLNSLPPKHEVCATNDGTLIRCPEPEVELPVYSYAPGAWGSCVDGSHNRRVRCVDDEGNVVANSECSELEELATTVDLPIGQSCSNSSQCNASFDGVTIPGGGSCVGYQAAGAGGDLVSAAECNAPAGYNQPTCQSNVGSQQQCGSTVTYVNDEQSGLPLEDRCEYTPAVYTGSTAEVLGTCSTCSVSEEPPVATACQADVFDYCIGDYASWIPAQGAINWSADIFECDLLCNQAETAGECGNVQAYLPSDPLQPVCNWNP